MLHRPLLSSLMALIPAAALAGEAEAPPPAAAPAASEPAAVAAQEAGPKWSAMATAREEWRGRFASTGTGANESDQTLRLFLDFDARSPEEKVAVRGSFGLWWRVAQDYAGEDGRSLSLASPRDTDFWFDPYTLSAEWRPGGLVDSLEGGRQSADHGLPAIFDGLSLNLKPAPPVELFAYGGRSVHYFEVDPSLFENWMVGAGAGFRSDWWRFEVDYRLLTEDVPTAPEDLTQSGREPVAKTHLTNHSYGLAAWVRHGDWLNGRLRLRGIDDRFQLVGAAIRAEWIERQLGIDVSVDAQPSTLRELNLFDDLYFLTLGESLPHLKARVDVFKGFTSKSAGDYAIHLGGDARQLLGAEEAAFNRNLLRAYLLLSAQKIAGTGLYLSAIGEVDRTRHPDPVTEAAGEEETVWTAGGALGWDQKPLRVEIGTNYYSWRYVYYQSPEERADVREFYGDVRVKLLGWLALRARYSYEVFDRTIHTVTVSITEAL